MKQNNTKERKVGDFITATRSGSNETIQGTIVKCWKDVAWGNYLAEVETINGDIRLVTTETDTII